MLAVEITKEEPNIPWLRCDWCGGKIDDVDQAILAWDGEFGQRAHTTEILHKTCDLCRTADKGKLSSWMPLEQMMVYLLHYLKITPKQLVKAERRIQELHGGF